MSRPADEQLQGIAHGRDVGSDIDRVRHQQKADDPVKQPARVVAIDIGSEPMPADAADSRADDLDRHHQGIREDHRPQHAVAELRPGLGIGGDPAGIVIGGAGDQARPQVIEP